jgi:hypothetical protein
LEDLQASIQRLIRAIKASKSVKALDCVSVPARTRTKRPRSMTV